jgi:membrane protease YdiL (CAAX protease family)
MHALRFVFCQKNGRLRSGWRLLIFLAALFAAALLVGWLLQLAGLQDGGDESDGLRPLPILLSAGLLLASALIVSHFALRLFEGRSLATIGLPLRRPWAAGLAAGFGIGALPVVLIVAAVSLGGDVAIRLSDLSLGSILGLTLPAVLALLFLSSLEEVLLRGYAMQLLAEGGGRWFAALLTGLIFGLAHVENPGANILGLVNTGVNGVLLA